MLDQHLADEIKKYHHYRGHGFTGNCEVHVDKRYRGRTAKSLWRWMKRQAAIEPGIGHL